MYVENIIALTKNTFYKKVTQCFFTGTTMAWGYSLGKTG